MATETGGQGKGLRVMNGLLVAVGTDYFMILSL